MRGRLTIETVNAALDDIASHAEANSKLMAAARSNSVKAADRKRATTSLHCVAVSRHCMSFVLKESLRTALEAQCFAFSSNAKSALAAVLVCTIVHWLFVQSKCWPGA